MAERRAVADREQRGGLVGELSRCLMSNGKDATMTGQQLPPGDQPSDGGGADPGSQQLPA